MNMNLLLILVIFLFLIVVYISKTNRSNAIKALYVVFGTVFLILMMILLYGEQVLEKGNYTNFAVISFLLFGLLVWEGLEVFEMLPDLSGKTIGEKTQ